MSTSTTTAADTASTEPVANGGSPSHPPRRRWSPTLFLGTISATLLTIGTLWLADLGGVDVPGYVYPAVALAVITVGVFIGAFWGDAGALVVIGLLLLPVLGVSAIASQLPEGPAGTLTVQPTTANQALEPVDFRVGSLVVDLRGVVNPEDLAGRTLRVTVGAADTQIIVPADVPVAVDARIEAGTITVFGQQSNDGRARMRIDSTDPRALHIVIDQRVGNLEVTHQ